MSCTDAMSEAHARLQQAARATIADLNHTIRDIERGATPNETAARLQVITDQANDRLNAAINRCWLVMVKQDAAECRMSMQQQEQELAEAQTATKAARNYALLTSLILDPENTMG